MIWTTLLETDLDSCITLVRYNKYLANCATNNINVWFYTSHTLYDPGELDLIVLQIVLQIIQESLHTFRINLISPSLMYDKINQSPVWLAKCFF